MTGLLFDLRVQVSWPSVVKGSHELLRLDELSKCRELRKCRELSKCREQPDCVQFFWGKFKVAVSLRVTFEFLWVPSSPINSLWNAKFC